MGAFPPHNKKGFIFVFFFFCTHAAFPPVLYILYHTQDIIVFIFFLTYNDHWNVTLVLRDVPKSLWVD